MDGFLLLDRRGRIMDANPTACNLLGYVRSELLQMGIGDYEIGENAGETAAHLAKIESGGGKRFTTD